MIYAINPILTHLKLSMADESPTVKWSVVRSEYKDIIEAEAPADTVVADLDAILDGKLTPFAPLDKIQAYSERLGTILSASLTGHAFINGKHFKLDDVTYSEVPGSDIVSNHLPHRTFCRICKWKSVSKCNSYKSR